MVRALPRSPGSTSVPFIIQLLRFTLAGVLCLGAATTAVRAQSTVTVRGTITDSSRGALAEASVETVVAGRVYAVTTTATDGRYTLTLPTNVPGQLRVRRAGFADQITDLAATSTTVERDIALAIGTVSDTLVVTATRGLESRSAVTESVSVMTAADIAALGSTSLADVLRFVPGVNLESSGREGALTSLFSRGGESDYNLVLIDGVRANLSGGAFDFSRIAGTEIERVEVVRGAQSSLWGSDAMGAVVQVFTRRSGAADAPQVSGSLEAGSFGTWRGDARVAGGARRRVDYQAGLSHRRSDGAFADLLPEDDRFEQNAFDAGAGMTLGQRASLRTGLRYSRGKGRSVGPIAFGARDTGTAYNTKDLSAYVSTTHSVGARYAGTATVNYFRYENDSIDTVLDPAFATYAVLAGTPNALFPNGTRLLRVVDEAEFARLSTAGALPAPGQFLASAQSFDFTTNSVTEFRRPSVRYQGDFTWATGQRLTAGYEWERETSPPTAGFSLDNNAVFVQQQFALQDRWFATAGVRVDRKESYDTFVSPKLSIGGFLVPYTRGAVSSVKAFANVGKGIKSPTFGERFGGPFADPDPNLEVERARTVDVGVEATFASQSLRTVVTYFHNAYTDQIAYRSGLAGDGIPEYINIDGSEAAGWELELALQRPLYGFTASGNYSLVDTEVVTNVSTSQQFQPGQPLLRRPRHSGTLRAAYVLGRAAVHFNLRLIGERHDNSFLFMRTVPNAERPTALTTDITINPGYAVAGLGFDVKAFDALTLFVRGDNLGGSDYQGALGYPGLPRAVVAGVRFNVGTRR